jgi:pyruvate dehydrogenase E1 component
MYYLTVYNEPMLQPAEPDHVDTDGIIHGLHRIHTHPGDGPKVQLLASGVSVPWALEAADLLATDWAVSADVWSVTSWTELRRDALAAEEHNFLHPDQPPRQPYLTKKLRDTTSPIIAATDYVSDLPDQIRQYLPNPYATLGANGHGFSDTRPAARRHFHIDTASITVRALQMLTTTGHLDPKHAREAADKYALHDVNAGTTGNTGGES